MAFRKSILARNAELDTYTRQLDGGTLQLYTGTQPATPETPASGTLLVTLGFAAPAFGIAADGKLTAQPLTRGVAVADGTAGWFRAFTAAGAAIYDGKVGRTDAELILAAPTLAAGAEVEVTSHTITNPL